MKKYKRIVLGNVFIKRHPIKGRCVYANFDFKRGELIEENCVIPVTYEKIKRSELDEYSMYWNHKLDCISLGSINLLNHSENPNVRLKKDIKNLTMKCYAMRNIRRGEELTIDYDCDLWFNPI